MFCIFNVLGQFDEFFFVTTKQTMFDYQNLTLFFNLRFKMRKIEIDYDQREYRSHKNGNKDKACIAQRMLLHNRNFSHGE